MKLRQFFLSTCPGTVSTRIHLSWSVRGLFLFRFITSHHNLKCTLILPCTWTCSDLPQIVPWHMSHATTSKWTSRALEYAISYPMHIRTHTHTCADAAMYFLNWKPLFLRYCIVHTQVLHRDGCSQMTLY